MTYPTITHINDVLPSIEGRTEFAIKRDEANGYQSVDYHYVLADSFDDPIRRECRGIKFDMEGNIIARPLHKFFNLNEKPETADHLIDLSQPHELHLKLDWSMVHAVDLGDRFELMTRAGLTDVAEACKAWVLKQPWIRDFQKWCAYFVWEGFTPIFEWTSPENRIVIPYKESNLHLIAMRHTKEGWYAKNEDLTLCPLPIVESLLSTSIEHLQEQVRIWTEDEGVVIRMDNGPWVKIKSEDYVFKHKAKDMIGLEKNAVETIITYKEDDVCSLLPAEDAEALRTYARHLRAYLDFYARWCAETVKLAKALDFDRKAFAIDIVMGDDNARKVSGAMFKAWDHAGHWNDGRFYDARDWFHEQIEKACKNGNKLDELLGRLNLPRWCEYYPVKEESGR